PHGTVEGAEAAVFGAEVGVVDIAIDDVADDSVRMQLAADLIGGHAESDQIVAAKQVDGFVSGHHTQTPPGTTAGSKVAARCRNTSRPAYSRSPSSKRIWRVRYSRTRDSASARRGASWRTISSLRKMPKRQEASSASPYFSPRVS